MSATAAGGYACNNSGTFSSKESASIVAKVSGDVEKRSMPKKGLGYRLGLPF